VRTLILGGARSGKSALAERLAAQQAAREGKEVVVIVTAEVGDAEMAGRIAAHRAQRPAGWRTVEAPLSLATALQREASPGRVLVVDCLTLWLSNLLLLTPWTDDVLASAWQPSIRYVDELAQLQAALPRLPGDILLIGNEVGHGVVPLGALNRVFVDENGRLHQALATHCDAVRFVMAGCVLALKG
jgi:adenosylcobinamide kinase/adenosylcobinamide-phosphate guanylyltransferase